MILLANRDTIIFRRKKCQVKKGTEECLPEGSAHWHMLVRSPVWKVQFKFLRAGTGGVFVWEL